MPVDMHTIRSTLVKEVMRKKKLKRLKPTDRVATAIKWLCTHELSMLPVMDGDNYLGEVVESDLLKIIIDPRDMPTRELMTEPLLGMSFFPKTVKDVMRKHRMFISQNDSLREASKKMFKAKAGILPVMHEGKLVGLLYADDIIHRLIK